MNGLPSYYATPVADERLRGIAESLAAFSGSSYENAMGSIKSALGPETRSIPRYMIAMDRSVVRLWGAPLLHNGKKARK